MRTAIALTGLAASLACSLAPVSAHARARVFVASYGNDSNPCTFGSPCKTFQAAISAVDAGGEVTAIDSAGFGPINVTKAVTITSPDGVEAGIVPVAGGDAIDINAGPSDAVVLRGLTLNGGGVGYNGVVFNSGASLTVTNCVAQNFVRNGGSFNTGNGILLQPTSGTVDFTITNTIVANNGDSGIFYFPPSGTATANGAIDHVVATGNAVFGIAVDTETGGSSTMAVISNSVANNNGNTGIFAANGAGAITVSIDNASVSGNSNGITGTNTTKVLLGRSVVTANGTGVSNGTSPNTFFTYKDNRINLNTSTDISSPLNAAFALQ